MPTVTYSLDDIRKLTGRKISVADLEKYLVYAKAELDEVDGKEVKIEFSDTNLPYLWSVEGFSLLLKGILDKESGIPPLKINKGKYSIKVDSSVKKIRPYISAFVAKNGKMNPELLKQLIQLQEKLADNFGRRREKIAIGVYSYDLVEFPITYKAVKPESVKFVPLESQKEMNLAKILKEHPKGIEYAHILKDVTRYPILMDSKQEVLSFPPIINSNHLGKLDGHSEHLFFEATGMDEHSVHLATNIFAQALHERGFDIYSVDVKYPKKVTTPYLFNEKIKLDISTINQMLGLDLKKTEIKRLLQRMRFDVKGDFVMIPHLRRDIMHQVDIVEDIAVSYGFDNMEPALLQHFTVGSALKINRLIDNIRELFVGMGYQEAYSQILSNKDILYTKMGTKNPGTVEIEEYMTETYSVIRTWLLPILMDILSKNKHVEYPHKVFEQGLATERKGSTITDIEKLAAVVAHEKADFTQISQSLATLFASLGFEYSLEETKHNSFIPGRVGKIMVQGKNLGFLGEISPQVLENFNLSVPVAAMELNVSELFGLL